MEKVEVQIDPSLCKDLVIGNTTYRSACDFHVTEADLERARKELGETEEIKRHSLEELKKMLSNDKRIRYRTDDEYLIRILRHRKFDVKRAYKFLQGFYRMRYEDPALFNADPSRMEVGLKGKMGNLMPYTNEDGELIFLVRLGDWDTSKLSMRDLLNMIAYVSDVLSMNPHAQIHGFVCIYDCGGCTRNHLSAVINPLTLRLSAKFLQDVYPWRIKKIILLNCGALVYAALSVIRYFLKKKVAERLLLIRSDLTELHEHVNPAILPKEYSGCLDDDECYSYLKRVIFGNKEYLLYENTFIGYR